MFLRPDEAITFDHLGPRAAVTVTLRTPNREQRLVPGPHAHCTAEMDFVLPRRASTFFEALARGTIPEGCAETDFLPAEHRMFMHRQDWPTLDASRLPFLSPSATVPFLSEPLAKVSDELLGSISLVVGLARWRCDRPGPVSLQSAGELEWSVDRSHWLADPRQAPVVTASFGPDLVVTPTRRADNIDDMIKKGASEPLHQSLLREAQSLQHDNPRSALAIGVAAAEIAVKALVSDSVPTAAWLVQNLPSPPIAKIMADYIPLLPNMPKVNERPATFPPSLIKQVTTATNLRNELVHGKREGTDTERVAEALSAAEDVVWLTDYFQGQQWAIYPCSTRYA
jgi:hypothetical protein